MNSTKPTPGKAWTNGSPSELLLAAGECSKCGSQIIGKRVKGRAAAIKSMQAQFETHECDPAQTAQHAQGRPYRGVPWTPR
jgi:hypothetical protein